MVKAAALYIVIIVSLLIAVISASLLTIAFYYRLEVQKKVRFDKLSANLESATTIVLSGEFIANEEVLLDLFDEETDSVALSKNSWGVFELYAVKAFELKDTLKRSFFTAAAFPDQSAIYLADEDRPLSVSGTTQITGNGELPKSGLKQAYVDGKPFAGKELIKGRITDSKRELPVLDKVILDRVVKYLKPDENPGRLAFNVKDSVVNSFFNKELVYQLSPLQGINNVKISGKVILVSDTTINISADAILEDVQVYAPAIIVADGFKGSCQLFARDSIVIGKNCDFAYPSFAGVFKALDGKIQSSVSLAEGSRFAGVLLSYEEKRSELQTIIALGKNCMVSGEVYATGYIKMERAVKVNGKVTAKRFIMQTPATLYENYLIDIVLNRKLLSKYYLSPFIFSREETDQNILKWLN